MRRLSFTFLSFVGGIAVRGTIVSETMIVL